MGFLFICIIALTAVSFLSILGAEPFVFDLEEELLPLMSQGELIEEAVEDEINEDETILDEEVSIHTETQESNVKVETQGMIVDKTLISN